MKKHLVFYDGTCGFCDHVVQFLLKQDSKGIFVFAPLQGVTAKKLLVDTKSGLEKEDSLVLIEDYQTDKRQTYILGRGAFRILWLLGGAWAIPGAISFLPSFLYDWGYRLVARNRHRFFRQDACVVPDPKRADRFLK